MSYKLLGLVAFVAVCSAVKIPVTVYYESLCPDSAAFITQQLFPVAKNELKDFIDITWVPFGKSNYTTRGSEVEFKCHHGPNECYGNKVHACAIKHIQANSYQNEHTRESLILDFVNCLMMSGKNFPDDVFGEKCAKDTQINNWGVIVQCAKEEEGSRFLKEFGDKTAMLRPNLTSVPTIVFNQQYDQDNQAKALVNFRGALCKFISQPQPQVCSANSGSIPITTISTWLSVVALGLARFL